MLAMDHKRALRNQCFLVDGSKFFQPQGIDERLQVALMGRKKETLVKRSKNWVAQRV
jgi:hypothetical protein